MYCPKCSQQQVSDEVRFCSRCGFLLSAVAEIVKNDGKLPDVSNLLKKKLSTPRKRGVKQGLFGLLLLLLISPIWLIIAKELEIHPAPVFLTLFVVFISCVIRMIYALMFESNEPLVSEIPDSPGANILAGNNNAAGLPPAPETNPLADFVPPVHGKWRDSNELAFTSVTDVTTKQLKTKSE